jgi:phage tail-like protein
LQNEKSNYFILNRFSGLWSSLLLVENNKKIKEGKKLELSTSKKNFIELPHSSRFTLKNNLSIPLRLSYLDKNKKNSNKDKLHGGNINYELDLHSNFSFELDNHNMLYILEKDSKKIRKLSIDRYKQYGTTNTENLVFDEYITELKDLQNPTSITAGYRHIYILDGSYLYIYSKITFQKIKIIEFNDRVYLFKITYNEQIIFYSYFDDKTKIYKKQIDQNNKFINQKIEQDHLIINLFKNITIDEEYFTKDNNGIIDNKEQQEGNINDNNNDDEDDNGNRSSYKYKNKNHTDNNYYINNDNTLNNIIDISINNKLKILYVITSINFFVFDFDGNSISIPIAFKKMENEFGKQFIPTSLALDEEENDIYIGNTKEKEDQISFPIKIKFDIKLLNGKRKLYKKPKVDKIAINSTSTKIFLTKIKENDDSLVRIFLINIIRKENENNELDKTIGKDSMSEKSSINDFKYLDLKIIEEKSIYNIQSSVQLVSKSLDSLDEQTRWYKISLDQYISPNTFIEVYYCCSNTKIKSIEGNHWKLGSINSNDTLIIDCIGRYLKIRIKLFSLDENKSPIFSKMIVYFSMPTYLRYLPEIYQEDDESKRFLEKFLSIFQSLFEDTEKKKISFIKNLTVKTIPDGFLPWLSSWLSLSFDEEWYIDNIRTYLERAPDIFKKRGTKEGLAEIVSIYLQNTENKQNDNYNNNFKKQLLSNKKNQNFDNKLNNYFFIIDEEKKDKILLYNLFKIQINKNNQVSNIDTDKDNFIQYCFFVMLNPIYIDEKKENVIKEIIEKEKPAHTLSIVIRLPLHFIVNGATFLGINSVIKNRDSFMLGTSILSIDTMIGTEEN